MQALANIDEAIAGYIEVAKKLGKPIAVASNCPNPIKKNSFIINFSFFLRINTYDLSNNLISNLIIINIFHRKSGLLFRCL